MPASGRSRRSSRRRLAAATEPPAKQSESQARPRAAVLVPLAVCVVLLLVYLATLLPTMVDQDSGELVAAVHVQGIPHPTGYPLWLLLGRLFDYLPVGHTSAYRVGLASAVPAAAAGGVVSLIGLALTGQVVPAAAAGLTFGLWFPCWSQAVRAEVYGLGALLFALALLALRRWHRVASARSLFLLSLACGFVSMHHRTIFLAVGPAWLAAMALTPPRGRWPYLALTWLAVAAVAVARQSHVGMAVALALYVALLAAGVVRWPGLRAPLAAVGAFLAPFSLYLYLMARARQAPPVNWTNPDTLDRLIYHALGKQYFGLALGHSVGQMIEQAASLAPQVLAEGALCSGVLLAAGLPVIVLGAAGWWRRERLVAGLLAAGCGLLCFWVLQWTETSDLKVFLAPLGAVLALCGAVGLARLGGLLSRWRVGWAGPAALGVVICGGLLSANWPRADLSDLWEHRDRWVAALSQMAPNAVFVSDFDVPSFATLYLQNVEGLRRDITLVRAVQLSYPWYLDLIRDVEVREACRAIGFPEIFQSEVEMHEHTALFAHELAKRLQGKRTVYVLHGPLQTAPSEPPHFVSLSEDLMALPFARPQLLAVSERTNTLASFPAGISLGGFSLPRGQTGNGELVDFAVDWRLTQPLPAARFAVGLAPLDLDLSRFSEDYRPEARVVQGFFIAHGEWGLPPSPPGNVYRQRGSFIIPTNLAPGEYRLVVGIAPLPQGYRYHGWTEVGRITVTHRPPPRNGP